MVEIRVADAVLVVKDLDPCQLQPDPGPTLKKQSGPGLNLISDEQIHLKFSDKSQYD